MQRGESIKVLLRVQSSDTQASKQLTISWNVCLFATKNKIILKHPFTNSHPTRAASLIYSVIFSGLPKHVFSENTLFFKPQSQLQTNKTLRVVFEVINTLLMQFCFLLNGATDHFNSPKIYSVSWVSVHGRGTPEKTKKDNNGFKVTCRELLMCKW